jgi:hypothetical protein
MPDIIISPANVQRLCDAGAKYMLTAPMQYFNGTMTITVTEKWASFKEAHRRACSLRETENNLPCANIYFDHNDAEKTRYDLDDEGVLVMLYLILSEVE